MTRTPMTIATATMLVLLLAFTACSQNASTVDVQLASTPNPPRIGNNMFEVTVRQPDGTPVTDANVTMQFHMPAMPSMKMEEMRSDVTLAHQEGGRYRGQGRLLSPGNWDTTITVTRGGQPLATRNLTLTAQP